MLISCFVYVVLQLVAAKSNLVRWVVLGNVVQVVAAVMSLMREGITAFLSCEMFLAVPSTRSVEASTQS